jgi:hypothetical protein
MPEKTTFAELPTGVRFEITDLNALYRMCYTPMVRTPPGKWSPPGWPRWVLDYNAVRLSPKGDDWDKCWVNSNYAVELLPGEKVFFIHVRTPRKGGGIAIRE